MPDTGPMRFTLQLMPLGDQPVTDDEIASLAGQPLPVVTEGGVGVRMVATIVEARIEDGWVVADVEYTSG